MRFEKVGLPKFEALIGTENSLNLGGRNLNG